MVFVGKQTGNSAASGVVHAMHDIRSIWRCVCVCVFDRMHSCHTMKYDHRQRWEDGARNGWALSCNPLNQNGTTIYDRT